MKKRTFLFSIMLCLIGLVLVNAQSYRGFTGFSVIDTEFFEIIYPEESLGTARLLQSMADDVYREASEELDLYADSKIPVCISGHTEEFNGYMNLFPYPHIMLFDTPMDSEWTSFPNSLRSLFKHELVHALSLTTRSKGFSVFHTIFGGWVSPALLNSPFFMIEGVTVSLESTDGYGRINDPLVRQHIRQAVWEDKALTPFQASGVYDLPPFGKSYYEYGGLFSDFIQRNYGMEKYQELWKAIGKAPIYSLFFYRSAFYRIFSKIYDEPFLDVWNEFLESYRPEQLETNNQNILYDGELLISAIDTHEDAVFILDTISSSIVVHDRTTNTTSKLFNTDNSAYDIAVHPDGERMLVSSYDYQGSLAKAMVKEYYTHNGKKTGRSWDSVYQGRYFRDGIVALGSELHAGTLVYIDDGGEQQLLLHGHAELQFSRPSVLNDDKIAFILTEKGKRQLAVYDMPTAQVYVARTGLEDDETRWRYIRNLSCTDEKIVFSYNHNDLMYKPAFINLENGSADTVIFGEREFSGSVMNPVFQEEALFYSGAFSTWSAFMRYPETADSFSGTAAALNWEPWTPAAAPIPAINTGTADTGEQENSSEYPETQKYHAIKYMNPFRFWLPIPLLDEASSGFNVSGAAIVSFISDPTDMNMIMLTAGGDIVNKAGYLDINWQSFSFGLPLEIQLADKLQTYSDADTTILYRQSSATLGLKLEKTLHGGGTLLYANPGVEAVLLAEDPKDDSSAYSWDYNDPVYFLSLQTGISNLRRAPWQLFGNGASLTLGAQGFLQDREPRFDAMFRAAHDQKAGIRISMYGTYDGEGMLLSGESPIYDSTLYSDVAAIDYQDEAAGELDWIAGGELEFKLFSIDIQNNLSHLYYNRLFGTLAYRGVVYPSSDSEKAAGYELFPDIYGLHSLLFKAGTVVSAVPITMMPLRFSPYISAAFKLSNLPYSEDKSLYHVGLGFSIEW